MLQTVASSSGTDGRSGCRGVENLLLDLLEEPHGSGSQRHHRGAPRCCVITYRSGDAVAVRPLATLVLTAGDPAFEVLLTVSCCFNLC